MLVGRVPFPEEENRSKGHKKKYAKSVNGLDIKNISVTKKRKMYILNASQRKTYTMLFVEDSIIFYILANC